jgi:hypothetical protein
MLPLLGTLGIPAPSLSYHLRNTPNQKKEKMKQVQILGASLALLLASTASSHALAIEVLNPSFELRAGHRTVSTATDWAGSSFTELSADVGINRAMDPPQRPELGSTANQISSSISWPTPYTLTIAIGNRTSDSNNPTGTARFGLTAGTEELGVFTEAVSAPNIFQDFVYTFTTGAVAPTATWASGLEQWTSRPVRQRPA